MLARWELATGEAIWIGYRVAQTPDSINDVIADYRARGRTKLDGRRDWGAKHPQGRILIPFGPNKGGWRSFLDVASTTMGRGSIEMDPTAARRLGGT